MKKLLTLVMACVFTVLITGVLTGCDEDEVKVHRESEVTQEQQEMVVEP